MAELELTVTAAAKHLGRSESTVRRWLRDGRLRGRKDEHGGPGGTWYVDTETCEQLAAELATDLDATMTASGALQPGIDTTTLKELAELRWAVEKLTVRIESLDASMGRLLPPIPTEKPSRRPWYRRAWIWLKGEDQGGN